VQVADCDQCEYRYMERWGCPDCPGRPGLSMAVWAVSGLVRLASGAPLIRIFRLGMSPIGDKSRFGTNRCQNRPRARRRGLSYSLPGSQPHRRQILLKKRAVSSPVGPGDFFCGNQEGIGPFRVLSGTVPAARVRRLRGLARRRSTSALRIWHRLVSSAGGRSVRPGVTSVCRARHRRNVPNWGHRGGP